MQLVGPHLPSFGSAQGGSEEGRRVFGLADVVEFRFLVGQWCLGRRAIREVSARTGDAKQRKGSFEREGADFLPFFHDVGSQGVPDSLRPV